MSKHETGLYLSDMLAAIAKIERYTAGLAFEQFRDNDLVIDGVVRNLEIIGEAAKYVPEEWRARYAAVEWARVVGFRNIVIHQYRTVDVNVVWTIATERLPAFKMVLERMLRDYDEGAGTLS